MVLWKRRRILVLLVSGLRSSVGDIFDGRIGSIFVSRGRSTPPICALRLSPRQLGRWPVERSPALLCLPAIPQELLLPEDLLESGPLSVSHSSLNRQELSRPSPINLQALETLPSCLANPNRPTFVLKICCSVIIVLTPSTEMGTLPHSQTKF